MIFIVFSIQFFNFYSEMMKRLNDEVQSIKTEIIKKHLISKKRVSDAESSSKTETSRKSMSSGNYQIFDDGKKLNFIYHFFFKFNQINCGNC